MYPRALALALTLTCLGTACSEDAPLLPTEARTPPFSWDLYLCDGKGVGLKPGADLWLVRRSEHLEHVYALSTSGKEPARTVFKNLEEQFANAGAAVARQVASLRCMAVDLPDCYPQWRFLDELLGPGNGPGSLRLRQALADSFDTTARDLRMKNTLRLSIFNVLMAGTLVKAAIGKAAAAETRAAAVSAEQQALVEESTAQAQRLAPGRVPAAAVGAERLAVESGRLIVAPEISAIQARMVETEALEVGPRCTAVVEDLVRMRPSLERPSLGSAADGALWGDYVSYWERRFTELTASGKAASVRPPLTWRSYYAFRARFAEALKFQRGVSAELLREAELPRQERRMLGGMEKPRVDDNVGLSREGSSSRNYADQLVVDEATLQKSTPRVESFSTKQRDLRRMSDRELERQVGSDAREALSKYGDTVEIRRPGHPLFERRVTVSRVHLVYDEALTDPQASQAQRTDGKSCRERRGRTPLPSCPLTNGTRRTASRSSSFPLPTHSTWDSRVWKRCSTFLKPRVTSSGPKPCTSLDVG
jgi:hypothetical protein